MHLHKLNPPSKLFLSLVAPFFDAVLSLCPRQSCSPPKGCLHHKLRRHHVALHYFQKALEALGKGAGKGAGSSAGGGGGEAAAAGRGGGKDGHVSPAPTCEILYNTGLQLLLTEKPEQVRRGR